MEHKTVDINQRIPLHILNIALQSYLKNEFDEAYIEEQLAIEFKGKNRIKKAMRIIKKIVLDNPMDSLLQKESSKVLLALDRKNDRGLILISLLNASFPFSFDVLQQFGKYLAVQEIINTQTVLKSISSSYGGNRATENGFYSVAPMFIEAGILERPKTGLYSKAETQFSTVVQKFYKESFAVNKRIEKLEEFHLGDSYFEFWNF